MKSAIESLLFVAGKALRVEHIAKTIGASPDEVRPILEDLIQQYNQPENGIHLLKVEHDGRIKYQMVSNPVNAEFLQTFSKQDLDGELTRPALETLTIIAYTGPVTKPELEKIRGVNCSVILRNLSIRGLIEMQNNPQKGEQTYVVSAEFLQWLGVHDVTELPDYETLHTDPQIATILANNEE